MKSINFSTLNFPSIFSSFHSRPVPGWLESTVSMGLVFWSSSPWRELFFKICFWEFQDDRHSLKTSRMHPTSSFSRKSLLSSARLGRFLTISTSYDWKRHISTVWYNQASLSVNNKIKLFGFIASNMLQVWNIISKQRNIFPSDEKYKMWTNEISLDTNIIWWKIRAKPEIIERVWDVLFQWPFQLHFTWSMHSDNCLRIWVPQASLCTTQKLFRSSSAYWAVQALRSIHILSMAISVL